MWLWYNLKLDHVDTEQNLSDQNKHQGVAKIIYSLPTVVHLEYDHTICWETLAALEKWPLDREKTKFIRSGTNSGAKNFFQVLGVAPFTVEKRNYALCMK